MITKKILIIVLMVSASFVFAQEIGDKEYVPVRKNGEKVYKWMECIEVVEYNENGSIRNCKSLSNYESILGEYNYEGVRKNMTSFSDDYTIVYKKEDRYFGYDSERKLIPLSDNSGFEGQNSEKWFKNKKLIYEEYSCSQYEYEYDQKGNLIHYKNEQDESMGTEIKWDSEGNIIFYYDGDTYYFNEYSYYPTKDSHDDGFDSMAGAYIWIEYDNQKTPIRFFSTKDGWKKITGDELFLKDFVQLNKNRKKIMNVIMPDKKWTGTIKYCKNYDSEFKGGIQFEFDNKNQLIFYKNNDYEEYYEYDSENKLINYKKEKKFRGSYGIEFTKMIEEHYEYNSKGNKIRYSKTHDDFSRDWEKGNFNTKGNKSSFKDSEGNTGLYCYEYYPSGAVKIHRKFKYLRL